MEGQSVKAEKQPKHLLIHQEVVGARASMKRLEAFVDKIEGTPSSETDKSEPQLNSLTHFLDVGAERVAEIRNGIDTAISRLESLLF